jgi:hypothetical protein
VAPSKLQEYEKSEVSLLARQPARIKSLFDQDDPHWTDLYQHLQTRLAMLRTWRVSWWLHWSKLAEYILPQRYHFLITPNRMDRGKPLNEAIIDTTGTRAMRICASGLMSGLMSPSRPWFRLDIANNGVVPDRDTKAWLDDTRDRMLTIMAGSNFYSTMAQMFEDIVTFGTSYIIIYEDQDDVIHCYCPCAGEYFLDTGGKQKVTTFYREFVFNVYQIVGYFGLEACPDGIRQQWAEGSSGLETEYTVCHAIEPNTILNDKKGGEYRPVPKHFPYREVYWLLGTKGTGPLAMRGFADEPGFAARWSIRSNDGYGRSPGMDALPDIMQLQQEQIRKGEFIDKCVRPPMVAPVELENKPASILPAQVTYVSQMGVKFEPAFTMNPLGIQPLSEDIKEVQGRINEQFYVDIFMMLAQLEGIQPRNQMEIAERKGERIQALGPVIELFENEVAGPAITRIFNIMTNHNMIAPMPQSMKGMAVKIEYVSQLKMAQRAAETTAMERAVTFASEIAKAGVNAVLPGVRKLKLDALAAEYFDALYLPASLTRSDAEIAQMEKAQQAQVQNEQTWQRGLAGVQALQSLSKTDVGGGQNAVSAALGTPPSPDSSTG